MKKEVFLILCVFGIILIIGGGLGKETDENDIWMTHPVWDSVETEIPSLVELCHGFEPTMMEDYTRRVPQEDGLNPMRMACTKGVPIRNSNGGFIADIAIYSTEAWVTTRVYILDSNHKPLQWRPYYDPSDWHNVVPK